MRLAVSTMSFCVAGLLALGMVILYSSSMQQVGAHYLIMQLLWCGMGLGLCVTAATIDYRWLGKMAWPLLAMAVVLLALVLMRHPINGSRRWFSLGRFGFQPSEFAKLA